MSNYSTQVLRRQPGPPLPLAYQLEPKLYKSVTVAQLVVTGLEAGDFVRANGAAEVEILADGPERAMCACYLKATKTTSNVHNEGLLLQRPMGVNILKSAHYGMFHVAGSFLVTDALAGAVNVMFVMYAANVSGNPSDARSLASKYVELRADVFKPVSMTISANGNIVLAPEGR